MEISNVNDSEEEADSARGLVQQPAVVIPPLNLEKATSLVTKKEIHTQTGPPTVPPTLIKSHKDSLQTLIEEIDPTITQEDIILKPVSVI